MCCQPLQGHKGAVTMTTTTLKLMSSEKCVCFYLTILLLSRSVQGADWSNNELKFGI